MSQEKITVYNLADLKNTSDDAIPNYLNSLKFAQSHRLADVRLALGYGALAVAAACFLWDWKLGFDATKYYSAAAVVLYAVLNTALTLWSKNVERNTVYVGTSPDGETVSIATSAEKYTPVYNVEVTVTPKSGGGLPRTIKINRPFSEWFDSAGSFVARPFQSMLATAVPAIGRADPKRVATAAATAPTANATSSSSSVSEPKYSVAVLDALAAASAGDVGSESDAATATGASGSQKKGGKRRKA